MLALHSFPLLHKKYGWVNRNRFHFQNMPKRENQVTPYSAVFHVTDSDFLWVLKWTKCWKLIASLCYSIWSSWQTNSFASPKYQVHISFINIHRRVSMRTMIVLRCVRAIEWVLHWVSVGVWVFLKSVPSWYYQHQHIVFSYLSLT